MRQMKVMIITKNHENIIYIQSRVQTSDKDSYIVVQSENHDQRIQTVYVYEYSL